MQAWRIAQDARSYQADDMSGEGARLEGGRWNSPGRALVYAATSRALAALETLVHFGTTRELPWNRYLVEIRIPDAVWNARVEVPQGRAPIGWDAMPAGQASLDLGDRWLAEAHSALLLVPSVVVPEEFNVLVNPRHPDAAHIEARKVRRWIYDVRL